MKRLVLLSIMMILVVVTTACENKSDDNVNTTTTAETITTTDEEELELNYSFVEPDMITFESVDEMLEWCDKIYNDIVKRYDWG